MKRPKRSPRWLEEFDKFVIEMNKTWADVKVGTMITPKDEL